MGALAALATQFGPLAIKLLAGLVPSNVATVLTKAVTVAKQGLAVAGPALSVLENAAAQDERGEQIKDINTDEMHRALEALNAAGPYEAAMAEAKAQQA